ncbi:MAG: DNA methyltransferase [Alphaproteobacteria bacterium]
MEERPIAGLRTRSTRVRRLDRRHVSEVARGIAAHGFCVPVLITTDGEVIDGDIRVVAARTLHLQQIPCIVIDHLAASQVRTLRLAVNRLQEKGEWDVEALRLEFEALIDLDVELAITGFEAAEIDLILLDDVDEVEAALDPRANALADLSDQAVSRPDDLWQLGDHRLLCGDARDLAAYGLLLDGKVAHALFTDPPYNVPIQGHVSGKGRQRHREFVMGSGELSAAQFETFLADFLSATGSVLAPGALAYVCMDWRHLRELTAASSSAGYPQVNLCVWVKPNGAMGSLYRSQHELVAVYKHGAESHQNNVQLGKFGRNRTNVWNYAGANTLSPTRRADLALHPTVKPVELVADAILDATSTCQIVLDPFVGSGTSLIAAERTRRVCAAIELDPLYVDVAIRRWQDFTRQAAVHAESGRPFDELARERLAADTDHVAASGNPESRRTDDAEALETDRPDALTSHVDSTEE